MRDQILEWIRQYAPVVIMLVMCFIDRFGFGNVFSSFRKDITDALNVKELKSEFSSIKSELRSVTNELKESKAELAAVSSQLQKVKRGKNEQQNKGI